MPPTKDVANWGDRLAGTHSTNQAEIASDDVPRHARHYGTRRQINDALVIEDNSVIDFKSPLDQLELLVAQTDNVVEYLGFTIAGARYDEPREGLVGARGVGFWHVDPEPGHDQWKECLLDSPTQVRSANRLGMGKVTSTDRLKEPARRPVRMTAKDGIYLLWKGAGTGKSADQVVEFFEPKEANQFALGTVIFDYLLPPEPEISPFGAITRVAGRPAADELTIIRRESDSHQSLAEDGSSVFGEREKLFLELANAFDAIPFENGIAHPAEMIICSALGKERSFDWFLELVDGSTYQSIVPSALRCIGRMVDVGTAEWRINLITNALASIEAEVRDAAVQVVESWAGKDLVRVLESHHETVPWIRDYIDDVIADLGA